MHLFTYRVIRLTTVAATAMALMAIATSAQSAAFRVRFDPLFSLAFSGAVGETVGWNGSATITVDDGCLVPGSIQTVGVGPCVGGASLDGGLLTFYDTVPANELEDIVWAGLFPPPLQLSIDAFGNVDGMEFGAPPLTSAGFTVVGWPSTYNVALTFTFADGPLLTLTDTAAPFTTYTSGEDGEDYVPVVKWSRIPEPSSLALVGGALAIVGLLRRRRN